MRSVGGRSRCVRRCGGRSWKVEETYGQGGVGDEIGDEVWKEKM